MTVLDSEGTPVAGASVVPLGYGRNNVTLWPGGPAGTLQLQSAVPTVTDQDGRASMALIPHNAVTMRATPPEPSGLPGTTATVDVSSDSEHTIRLVRPVTFSGVLRTSRGVPIPDASIGLKGPSTGSTTTSGTGAFSLAVAPGSYTLEIDRCCSATPDYPSLIMIRINGFDLTADVAQDPVVPVEPGSRHRPGPGSSPGRGHPDRPSELLPHRQSVAGRAGGLACRAIRGAGADGRRCTATVGLIAHNPVTLLLQPPEELHLANAVVANLDARTDTTTVVILKIDEASVRSLAVTPASPHTLEGTAKQLTATATYTDGTTKDITSAVTWSSSATGVATVDANGLARGIAPGTATIRATAGSLAAETTLTVDAAAKDADLSIAIAQNAGPIRWGEAVTYTLTAQNGARPARPAPESPFSCRGLGQWLRRPARPERAQ